ncbi:MAG: transporter permease, partial [Friedmanniella sp.]|nr:transporter permease [Friedmanniella sp.]
MSTLPVAPGALPPQVHQQRPAAPRRRTVPWSDVVTTLAAFVLALVVGAVLMVVSDTGVRRTFAYFFARPSDALTASWDKVGGAYAALLRGSVGGLVPLTETTAQAAPLICAGLGVGLAFRAGLFNIGAQGQAILGASAAAYVGFALHLPPGVHLLVALVLGLVAGGLWGGVVGWLKARAGAHEVIVTIMMNYIAA